MKAGSVILLTTPCNINNTDKRGRHSTDHTLLPTKYQDPANNDVKLTFTNIVCAYRDATINLKTLKQRNGKPYSNNKSFLIFSKITQARQYVLHDVTELRHISP